MSESQGDSQPAGQSRNGSQSQGGQPRSSQSQGSQSRGGQSKSGPSNGGQPRGRGGDPVADFQRWLMKAGARSMANQVADQVKRTLGQEKRRGGDVWDTATNELPPNEPPECQWCPVCQAARAARMSGPGLGATLASAAGGLASVVQDAFSAFEQVMKAQNQTSSAEKTGTTPAPGASDPRGDTTR